LSRGRCRNRQSSSESSPRSRRARCRASYIPHIAGYHSIRDAPLWTASGHCGESGRGRVAVNCQIDGSIRSARSLRLSGRCRSRSRSKSMGLNKLERYSHGGYLIKVVVAGEVLKSSPLFCHGLITIMIASGEGKGTRSADSGRCWCQCGDVRRNMFRGTSVRRTLRQ
jgi:hypothetical protein